MRSHCSKLFRSCFQRTEDVTEIVEDLYFPHSHTSSGLRPRSGSRQMSTEGFFLGLSNTHCLYWSVWADCHLASASFVLKFPKFLVALIAFTLEELFTGKGFPSGNLSFLIH